MAASVAASSYSRRRRRRLREMKRKIQMMMAMIASPTRVKTPAAAPLFFKKLLMSYFRVVRIGKSYVRGSSLVIWAQSWIGGDACQNGEHTIGSHGG